MALRLALRRLAATPAISVGAVAVIALGTGATLAVFSILNALVLRPLPVPEPGRLAAVEVQNARGEPSAMPRQVFDALTQRQHSLDLVAGVLGGSVVSAKTGSAVHQVVVDGVTADYFRLFGLRVVAGRPLGVEDYRDGTADPVAVINEGYANRMFGTPSKALGRAITLGESTVTVVGITADAFLGVQVGVRTDIVVPAPVVGRIISLQPNSVPLRYVFGRVVNGLTLNEVRAEWSAIWQTERASSDSRRQPPDVAERRLVVSPGATGVSVWRSRYVRPLKLTMIASVWLVVIACINLAGLQFARGRRREREIAVCRALGASRWDAIWPTVLESLLVCLMGLAFGARLAGWGAHLATDLMSTGPVPLDLDLGPNWFTWAALAALISVVSLISGAIPAWLAQRDGDRATTPRLMTGGGRIGSTLVVSQISLAVVLLSGAAFAMSALFRVTLGEHGIEPDHILAAQLMNRPGGYTDMNDAVYYRTLVDHISALPGVSAVALAKPIPGALSAPPIQEPVTAPPMSKVIDAGVVVSSPGYFETLGISLLIGRAFTWRDDGGAPPVAVISKALAQELMPDGILGGLRINVGTLPHHRGVEVIGIVGDASVLNIRDPTPRVVYLSALQQPPPMARWPGLLVRTRPAPHSSAPAIADAIGELGREFVLRTDMLSGHIARALARERLLAIMATVYGSLAVAMVVMGLGSLLAHDITRRVQEFGIRLSLGASPTMLFTSVTVRAVYLAAIGSAIGAALTWILFRVVEATIGIDGAPSSWTVPGVIAVLLIIAACSAMGPARRAARVEPMAALRSE